MKDKKQQGSETYCLAGGTGGARASIVVRPTERVWLDLLLAQVFDVRPLPVDGDFARTDAELRVTLELSFRWGDPVDASDATDYDEDQWFDWLDHVGNDLERSHALFLTNVPLEAGIQARYGIRPNVIAVRPGASSYVLVSFSDDPSDQEFLRRLHIARCLLSH